MTIRKTGVTNTPSPFYDKGDVFKKQVFDDFVTFIASPDVEKAEMFEIQKDERGRYRSIPNQNDFAKRYGVSKDTLSRWKGRRDFIEAVDLKRKQWGLDKVPNVLAALYARCVKYGMAYDVETYLAYFANWSRTQVLKHVQEKFDADDIRALLAPLPKEKQDEFFTTLTNILAEAEIHGGIAKIESDRLAGSGNDSEPVRGEADNAPAID